MIAIDDISNFLYRATMNKYIASFEEFFAKAYSFIDVENLSLFQIIEILKKNDINSCDPNMLSVIIQDKLDSIDNLKLCLFGYILMISDSYHTR